MTGGETMEHFATWWLSLYSIVGLDRWKDYIKNSPCHKAPSWKMILKLILCADLTRQKNHPCKYIFVYW